MFFGDWHMWKVDTKPSDGSGQEDAAFNGTQACYLKKWPYDKWPKPTACDKSIEFKGVINPFYIQYYPPSIFTLKQKGQKDFENIFIQ